MELGSNEKSILAYFPDSQKAAEAKQALLDSGYQVVQVDRISRYGVNYDAEINNPIAGQAETQTGLTLYSADTDQFADNDARVLLAADPSVSGIGDNNYGVAGGASFMVTVVTQDNHIDQAVKILEEKGGMV